MRTMQITPSVTALSSVTEIPNLGALQINAFLIKDREPILIDTGFTPEKDKFLAALGEMIDPSDLRWIWLTHSDRDHTGAISELLEMAPNARVICTFITLGLMSAGNQPIPPERTYLVRHGTTVPTGSGDLTAFRPPLFDNPGTIGFVHADSGVMFSSDFLGAALPSVKAAGVEDVGMLSEDEIRAGQLVWGSVDAPWAHSLDEAKLAETLAGFRALDAQIVLSSHLPPIRGAVDRHLETIAMLPGSDPTILPDQAALEAAMSQIAHGG